MSTITLNPNITSVGTLPGGSGGGTGGAVSSVNTKTGAVVLSTIQTISSDVTVSPSSYTENTYLIDCSAGDRNITLPAPSSCTNSVLNFKKIDITSNKLNLIGTVDGVVNYISGSGAVVTPGTSLNLQSDGTAFWLI